MSKHYMLSLPHTDMLLAVPYRNKHIYFLNCLWLENEKAAPLRLFVSKLCIGLIYEVGIEDFLFWEVVSCNEIQTIIHQWLEDGTPYYHCILFLWTPFSVCTCDKIQSVIHEKMIVDLNVLFFKITSEFRAYYCKSGIIFGDFCLNFHFNFVTYFLALDLWTSQIN